MIKKIKFKSLFAIIGILFLTLFIARPLIERGINRAGIFETGDYAIDFIDDAGYRIRMATPADTIISLYSAHTENLFALGLDREIIGVGTSDIYPYEALSKEIYDYKSDPEKVIAANPDVVLIRPFVERYSPDFVKSLRRTGITVVSLYPDTYDDFDDYITKLGMLTGQDRAAKAKLEEFYSELDALAVLSEAIDIPVGVYFESSDREYKTVTDLSMPAHAIEIAGGRNVANDAIPIEEGSSIAIYGIENILKKANEIDVYVTQRGVMGAGGNLHSISIRPGFDVIKAVKDGQVFEINQKIISSPTFRYVKGVKALQRAFYPDVFCAIEEQELTRSNLSEILVKYQNEMIFVPTTSYYNNEKEHYYGAIVDVTVDHKQFDFIETAMQKGFFESTLIDEEEYFYPETYVRRDEFAVILYMINDLDNNAFTLSDIEDHPQKRIIEAVVAAGLMDDTDGNFEPESYIEWDDLVKGLGL